MQAEHYKKAWSDPNVREKYRLLRDYVNSTIHPDICTSNYADQMVLTAFEKAKHQKNRQTAITELIYLYEAFIESIEPYQPEHNTSKVFYFLPGSGGYWVDNVEDLTAKLVRQDFFYIPSILFGFVCLIIVFLFAGY